MNRTACVFFIFHFIWWVSYWNVFAVYWSISWSVCGSPATRHTSNLINAIASGAVFFFKFHFELKSCVFFSLAAGFRGTHTRFCVMSIVIYLPAADSCGHVFAAAFSHSPSAPVFRNEIDDCRVTHCAQFAAPIRHSMSSIECMSLDFLCVFFIIIMISIEWTETHLFEASHQLWNSVNIKKQQQQQQSWKQMFLIKITDGTQRVFERFIRFAHWLDIRFRFSNWIMLNVTDKLSHPIHDLRVCTQHARIVWTAYIWETVSHQNKIDIIVSVIRLLGRRGGGEGRTVHYSCHNKWHGHSAEFHT